MCQEDKNIYFLAGLARNYCGPFQAFLEHFPQFNIWEFGSTAISLSSSIFTTPLVFKSSQKQLRVKIG